MHKELGMHGVMMPTNLAGKYLDESEFKPFWDALAAEDKPLFFIRPTRPARPTGTNIRCIKKFSGPPTAPWHLRASSIVACSIATRTSSSSRPTWVV